MANKQRQKLGMFSSKVKVNFQKGLREFKLQSLIQKSQEQELSKREKKMLGSSRAVRDKSFQKSGMQIQKGMPKYANVKPEIALQGSGSIGDGPANNLNRELNTSTTLSVKQFLGTTPTGVYSQSNVKRGVDEFMKQLKGTPSVQNVAMQKVGTTPFGNINVGRDFQKAQFKFNPKDLSFSTKGWDVDIPEEYIKKSDTHYVAPSQIYTKDYYKEKEDGRKKGYETKASYTPVEIFLQDGASKIDKILKRGTYTKKQEYEYDKDYYEKQRTKDVFLDEQQLFYKTGLLKQKKDWDDYTYEYDAERRGKYERRQEEEKKIFLRAQWDYNPKGYLKEFKRWDDYAEREKDRRSGTYDRDESEEGAIFLKDHQQYDDVGKMLQRKKWDDYISREDRDTGGSTRGFNIRRKIQLERDEIYDAGKKLADFKYREYVSDAGVKRTKNVVRLRDTGFGGLSQVSSLSAWNKTPSISAKYIDAEGKLDPRLRISSGVRQTIKRDTALQEATYYDPFTGDVIESFKYW